jgi:hypothetical protein
MYRDKNNFKGVCIMNTRIRRIVSLASLLACAAIISFVSGPVTAGNSLLISDFEDSKQPISTYAGGGSKVTTEYQTATVHGGKQALKVYQNVSNWGGALIELPKEKADWTGYTTLKMWIYGGKTGRKFNIDLEEAGKEQFRYTITDDWTGWKEFSIKLAEIYARSDWQPPDANKNYKLDFPLKTIQFFTSSSFDGTLIFDDISVEK